MFTQQELRQAEVFACLEDDHCARLAQTVADVRLGTGEWLTRDGETSKFYVLLQGHLRVVKDILGMQMEFEHYDFRAGDFLGEVPVLLRIPFFASIQAVTPCRLARLDKQQFEHLIRDSGEARAMILETFNQRLQKLQQHSISLPSSRVQIFGRKRDTDCHDLRAFLAANRIVYEWVDRDRQSERVPAGLSEDPGCPGVVVDGQVFAEAPTVREIAQALQLQTHPKRESYDLVIVGAGPAGMAAGVYGTSEGLSVLVVEKWAAGGQAGTSSRIENYLGFPEGISGEDLTTRGFRQATRFGAEVILTRTVEKISALGEGYLCELDGGEGVRTRSVLLTTGVDWRRLSVDKDDCLLGRGIFYGAARQEAVNIVGKKVFVVGGGNSAGQAAIFLSSYAAEVSILVRGEGLRLSMSQYLIEQIASKANIKVLPHTQVSAVDGTDCLEQIRARIQRPGETEKIVAFEAAALFVMIGADASTSWLPAELKRDSRGYICTGRELTSWNESRQPFPLETSLPGVFSAGDVRHNSIKRVSSGVGEGSMAVAFIHQYLALRTDQAGSLPTAHHESHLRQAH